MNSPFTPDILRSLAELSDHLQERVIVPLPDDLLKKHNFFELYPPDVIGKPDLAFGREVKSTRTIHPGGTLPHIDWRQYERWRTAEHSCVLNRFYFAASLARYCSIERDAAMARLVVETMIDFIDACPPQLEPQAIRDHIRRTLHIQHHEYNIKPYEEMIKDETDIQYTWFDFQPAGRLMHFLHAVYFLRDYPECMSAEERMKLVRSLYEHCWVLYHGEEAYPLQAGDNHQSTRAVALMMGAAFFKGIGLWREFAELAARIIAFHSRESFFADGVLKEISPTYHTSVTWHVRDACLLAGRLGIAMDPSVLEQLRKSVDYIRAMRSPTGRTVVIDDGREIAPNAWIDAMSPFIDQSSAGETFHFPDAGLSAIQRDGLFLVFDGSTFTGETSHYQGGKNAPIYWHAGKPFLVDSGCPDLYDDPLFSTWYRKSEAHSTLLVNGCGDARQDGFIRFISHPAIASTGWKCDQHSNWSIHNTLTSNDIAWNGITWHRTLIVDPQNQLTLVDEIESDQANDYTLIFNLHHDVKPNRGKLENEILLQNGSVNLMLRIDSSTSLRVEFKPGKIYTESTHHDTTQLRAHFHARGRVMLTTAFRSI